MKNAIAPTYMLLYHILTSQFLKWAAADWHEIDNDTDTIIVSYCFV